MLWDYTEEGLLVWSLTCGLEKQPGGQSALQGLEGSFPSETGPG